MTEPSAPASGELSARLAALEAENERLRSQAPRRPAGSRWRPWVSATCIVIASILVPVSVVTAWARVQLVDEDSFVSTLAPLASDPDVQNMIIDETMGAITDKVDFSTITSNVIDGIATLDLPPAAVAGLELLKQPAADGLESLVERSVTRVVTSPAFAEVWATATRATHRALTTTATSDGGGLVVRTNEGIGIQLGAIVERVRTSLTAQGVGIAGLIPTVDRVVILGDGDTLALVRTGYAAATAVGYWLPLLTLALFIAGILVARRRSTALLGSGIGVVVTAGGLAVGLSIGAVTVSTIATRAGLSPSGLGVVYAQLSAAMAQTALVLTVTGGVVALLAWFQTRSRAASAIRAAVASINAGIRRALVWRGVDTGALGSALYAQRAVVHGAIAALGILWLALLRPLTTGDIALVLVVCLIVWWVTDLMQRRPGESIGVSTDAAAQHAADEHAGAFGAAPASAEAKVDAGEGRDHRLP